jgi:succinate dehydrogenase hydrophobic anchor subunit
MLGAAGMMFAYLFYTATPDTTVYQLAQFGHQDHFWTVAFMIAVLYSMAFHVAHGPSQRHIIGTDYAKSNAAGSASGQR